MRTTSRLLVLLVVLTWPIVCLAQTDYSLRIRSLDVTFAGLLDDFLTDVYLNPARVSEIERPIVYAVKMPGRSVDSPFPSLEGSGEVWTETRYDANSFSTDPIGLSVFGSVKGKFGVALGSEIGLDAYENWSEDRNMWESGPNVNIREYGNGGSSDRQHYVFDLAVAPLKADGVLGLRVKGMYDRNNTINLRVEQTLGWRTTDLGNPYEGYTSVNSGGCYERTGFIVSAGYAHAEAFLRDAVIGASYVDETSTQQDETIKVLDEDPDGNGVPNPDYAFDSYYGATNVASDRRYTGFGGFLRAHLGWTDRLRSVLSASWSHSSGDGGSAVHDEYLESSFTNEEDLTYDYDGTVDRIQAECSIGYHEMLFDDVLFAFAAHGYFARTSFEEDAAGDLYVYRSEAGGSYTSPYTQRHDDVEDLYRLSIPMGVEWSFHKYAKLRVGAAVFAARTKTSRLLTNNIEEIFGSEIGSGGPSFDDQYESHDSSVYARLSNGLEINVNNRFIVDLAGNVSTWAIDLASYYYISARFIF